MFFVVFTAEKVTVTHIVDSLGVFLPTFCNPLNVEKCSYAIVYYRNFGSILQDMGIRQVNIVFSFSLALTLFVPFYLCLILEVKVSFFSTCIHFFV